MPPPGDDTEHLLDVLLRALRGYLAAVRADPVTWRLILMPPEGAPAFLRDRVERARAAVVAQLAELVERARQPQGGQASPDPETDRDSMSALYETTGRGLMLTDPDGFTPERILEHARWALTRFAPSGLRLYPHTPPIHRCPIISP